MLCTARDGLRYDDKVLITFNYKEGTETITFGEAVKAEKSSDMSARGALQQNPNFFPIGEGFGFFVLGSLSERQPPALLVEKKML